MECKYEAVARRNRQRGKQLARLSPHHTAILTRSWALCILMWELRGSYVDATKHMCCISKWFSLKPLKYWFSWFVIRVNANKSGILGRSTWTATNSSNPIPYYELHGSKKCMYSTWSFPTMFLHICRQSWQVGYQHLLFFLGVVPSRGRSHYFSQSKTVFSDYSNTAWMCYVFECSKKKKNLHAAIKLIN